MAVLQIVRFRAKPEVTDKDMLAINERFQREVAPTLPGLERREATRSPDGDWLLVLRYADMDHAAGGAARDTSPIAMARSSPATDVGTRHIPPSGWS